MYSEDLPVKIETHHVGSEKDKIIFYPQVIDFEDQQFEHKMNHSIVERTQELIDLQVGSMPSTVETMIGLFEIKNNQRQVLSLSLSNYTYHHKAAHGMTYIKSLTFDLKEKKLCNLSDLFKPGSRYVERLSKIINEQIISRDIPVLHDFTTIMPDQDFYLADKTIVIYFQLYDLTPYAFGFPMFPISIYEIEDIIKQDGPLGRLAQHN